MQLSDVKAGGGTVFPAVDVQIPPIRVRYPISMTSVFQTLPYGIKYVDDFSAAHSSQGMRLFRNVQITWMTGQEQIIWKTMLTRPMTWFSEFIQIYINGTKNEHMKKNILCVILSDNLKRNAHIGEIFWKANKRLFFLRLLKNACSNREDLIHTYTSLVRPRVEYACPMYGTLVCLNTWGRRWKQFKR